jgi:hypothetical protein
VLHACLLHLCLEPARSVLIAPSAPPLIAVRVISLSVTRTMKTTNLEGDNSNYETNAEHD